MLKVRPAVALILSLLVVRVSYAHDVWLLPERFSLAKGDTLTVRQMVGSGLEVEEELSLLRRITTRFELLTPEGVTDLLGQLPDEKTRPVVKPVLERKMEVEGQALVTMEHGFIQTQFPNKQFLEYLEHEEFEIERFRDAMGSRPAQRERYARTLKCLVQVGEAAKGDLHKEVLGQKIEILLLQNPYLLDAGDDLEVRVLFDGKPLRDHLVTAFNGDGKRLVSRSKARTNVDGIARLKLDRKGFWLIRLVHLQPSTGRSDVDWESYWTSYSFAVD